MVFLAALAIVFWFIVLPLLYFAIYGGTFFFLAYKSIRETEMADEQHRALQAEVERRKTLSALN